MELPFDSIQVKNDHIAGFLFSAFLSLFICLLQTLLGLKDIKHNLLKAYKGNKWQQNHHHNANQPKPISLATSNNHFAGFLVGFLLNGFLFIFAFFFLICLIVYYAVQFVSGQQFLDFFLKFVPIFVVFITKFIFNFICSKFIFLQGKYFFSFFY